MIAIDLSKQQVLDADPRAIQQINFMANLDRARYSTIFFIIEKVHDTRLDFFTRNGKSFLNTISLSDLIFISIK